MTRLHESRIRAKENQPEDDRDYGRYYNSSRVEKGEHEPSLGIDVIGSWNCKEASHFASDSTGRLSVWLKDVLQCPVLEEKKSMKILSYVSD